MSVNAFIQIELRFRVYHSFHLETRASPLQEVGRTRPSQRAGAKSPTRVITRSCKWNVKVSEVSIPWTFTFGRLARIVSWSGLIQRSCSRTRSYSVEFAIKAAIAAIWGQSTLHNSTKYDLVNRQGYPPFLFYLLFWAPPKHSGTIVCKGRLLLYWRQIFSITTDIICI